MELSCPAPKHCEYGRKMAAASEAHETPRLSATFSSHDPFKTARLNQAGRKNKLRHSCGVTATLATKNHKALKPPPEVANSGGPVPVARWPGPGGPVPVAGSGLVARCWSRARSRWPSPGGPVPVARSQWPGPGGPVPVARSRSRFKGACPGARAKKNLFWGVWATRDMQQAQMLEANQGHAVLSRLAQFHPTQSLELHTLEYYRGLNNQQYHFEVHLRYHIL